MVELAGVRVQVPPRAPDKTLQAKRLQGFFAPLITGKAGVFLLSGTAHPRRGTGGDASIFIFSFQKCAGHQNQKMHGRVRCSLPVQNFDQLNGEVQFLSGHLVVCVERDGFIIHGSHRDGDRPALHILQENLIAD